MARDAAAALATLPLRPGRGSQLHLCGWRPGAEGRRAQPGLGHVLRQAVSVGGGGAARGGVRIRAGAWRPGVRGLVLDPCGGGAAGELEPGVWGGGGVGGRRGRGVGRWDGSKEMRGLGCSGNVSCAPPRIGVGWVNQRPGLSARLSRAFALFPSPPGRLNGANRTHCLMPCTATRCSPIWTLSTSLAAKAATGEAQAWRKRNSRVAG